MLLRVMETDDDDEEVVGVGVTTLRAVAVVVMGATLAEVTTLAMAAEVMGVAVTTLALAAEVGVTTLAGVVS